MTISVEQIRRKLSPRFPDVEQIADSIVRFERKAGSRPFAVCYVDVSEQIPTTIEALNAYQEEVVARHYFDGSKSLQWSNYLYFVIETPAPLQTKVIVERDRKYSRKFVLTEAELYKALTPASYQVSESAIKNDILTTWTNILSEANLDRAILNDEPLTRRLELIEQQFGHAGLPTPRSLATPRPSKQPFLRSIKLDKFRQFPSVREFELGTVTLLCGANGSGKTSLLEAIELVYCGQTKRNPRVKDSYSIVATYSSGTFETASNHRSTTLFRDRNLAWYGQFEQKTTNLYQTFGRFNFLNTDAAVGLAEQKSEVELEEDLSKLMVGPDASKTWKEIERTAERVDDKIKELQTSRNSVELEFASVNRQIAELGVQKQESTSVLNKLDALLAEVPWSRSEEENSTSVQQLVETLSAYGIIAKDALACGWAGAPVTIEVLRQFVKEGRLRVESAEALVKQLFVARASEKRSDKELSQIDQALAHLSELSKFIDAGIPRLLSEIEQLGPLIAKHQWNTAGFKNETMHAHLLASQDTTVATFAKSAFDSFQSTTKQLVDSQKRYAEFSALREESASIAQRLRELAFQMLKTSANPDECPLCHTSFEKDHLAKRINADLDQQLEAKAAELLKAIRDNELKVKESENVLKTARWAEQASKRFEEPTSIAVSRLIQLVFDSQKECSAQILSLSQINESLANFHKNGMTADRYRDLSELVFAQIGSFPLEGIKEILAKQDLAKREKLSERDQLRSESQELQAKLSMTLAISDETSFSIESTLSQLKERLVTAESHISKIEPYSALLPWAAQRPISELVLTISTVRQVAGDYQQTFSKEQSSVKMLTETSSRKKQIEVHLAGLVPRIERLSQAREVMSKIQNEYSLPGAMKDALEQNRTAIEAIFSRVHSPAEFSGLGNSLTTLVRKSDGGTSTLQQISTGQRAAYALSLFLAQNAQLRTAPPLILIDDPIAHVDDLNCLSFLDYLREIVIAGERQVVFATANDKLAALFERKFDFLDSDFRRYDLVR